MQKVEESSLRRKINVSCSSEELNEIAGKICSNWGSWPMSLFFDLKHRILKGLIISEECLVDLIIISKSRPLYLSKQYFSIDRSIAELQNLYEHLAIERGQR